MKCVVVPRFQLPLVASIPWGAQLIEPAATRIASIYGANEPRGWQII
jgi:hypothetical protein